MIIMGNISRYRRLEMISYGWIWLENVGDLFPPSLFLICQTEKTQFGKKIIFEIKFMIEIVFTPLEISKMGLSLKNKIAF